MPNFERVATDLPVFAKFDDYTVSQQDFGCEFEFNKASAVTCALPAAAMVGNGFNVLLRNIGAGNLTVDPDGSEQIDGASTLVISQGDSHWIRCDGGSWRTFAVSSTSSSGGGKVLQVVSGVLNTTASTSSTTMASTGLSVSITPVSTSNKVLIQGTIAVSHQTSGYVMVDLRRGGTSIWPTPTSPSNRIPTLVTWFESDGGQMISQPFAFLDSPASTSALTYDIYYKSSDGAGTAYINRSPTDTDTSGFGRASSIIMAMEIEG